MRYVTTLALASISVMTCVAFVLEWTDIFVVLVVVTAVFIGLPVLSLASNFWFGETTPQIHVHEQTDEGHDRLWRR
jgi:hypothetical protein